MSLPSIADLIAFEREVADRYERGEIRGPVHLSGGNEEQLISIFEDVRREDWVFSTWRSHYHALLHGVPPDLVMAQIMAGRSMNLNFPEYRFFTSAIVGGILPIAAGVAATGVDVWCFIGDMTSFTGIYAEARRFVGWNLHLVIEDNGMSTNTPTAYTWRGTVLHDEQRNNESCYFYKRQWPHVGTGTFVRF